MEATATKWGDREGRREDIMRAGRELLEREGLAPLTIRAVARGAGVSPGTVYTYFADREELFAALYLERLERFQATIEAAAGKVSRVGELIRVVAGEYLDVYRVFGRELNVWALPASEHPGPEAVRLVEMALGVLATVQRELVRLEPALGRVFADPDGGRFAMPVAWALFSGLADQFSGQRHVLHEQAWDELVDFAGRVLLAGLDQITEPEEPY